MVDIRDLKSLAHLNGRVGSSPTPGTMIEIYNYHMPDGYVPRELWEDYRYERIIPYLSLGFGEIMYIPSEPHAIRVGLWPFYTYIFEGSQEPDISLLKRKIQTTCQWRRFDLHDTTPPNWNERSITPRAATGFCSIRKDTPHYSAWSYDTRTRYRNRWINLEKSCVYRIESVGHTTYINAFLLSDTAHRIGRYERKAVQTKLSCAFIDIRYNIIRRCKDNKIVAGMATSFSPKYKNSFYESGFRYDEVGKDPVMIGLMDNWFKTAQNEQVLFLQMGTFWQPGDSEKWKGYSSFKMKFGTKILHLPPILYRHI